MRARGRGKGTGPDPERGSPGRPPRACRRLVQALLVGHGTRGGDGVVLQNAGASPLCVWCRGQSSFFHAASPYMQINSLYLAATVVKMLIGVRLVIPLLGGGINLWGFLCRKGLWRSGEWGEMGREALGCCASGFGWWWCHSRELGELCK